VQSSPPRKQGTDFAGGAGGVETAQKQIVWLTEDNQCNKFTKKTYCLGGFFFLLTRELPSTEMKSKQVKTRRVRTSCL
jgi:hypothetical protein